ncbi:MAG: ABC transporter permease [Actinomycetota bacterium]|nr:MAG: ABC transporter permease [Actinomycetota bacterium]
MDKRRNRQRKGADSKLRLVSLVSAIAGLIVWQLVGEFVVGNNLFLATPASAIHAMASMSQQGTLWTDVRVSGEEFIIGFLIASAAGIIVGIGMASAKSVAAVAQPWVSGFYATPIVALAPLLILWFGIGVVSKIAVVFSLVVFPVIINTEAGINPAGRELIEAAHAFGATQSEVFKKVSIPAAAPYVLTGLRLGIGRGLIGVVVGELIGANAGLGFLINNAAQVFNMPDLSVGLVIFAIAGIALTAGFKKLEQRIVHWQGV